MTRDQADILTCLKPSLGFDVFKYVNGDTIAAQQYVGVFHLGAHTVEVLPKIDVEASNVRRNLVAMIATTLDLAIKEGEMAYVGTQSHGILEILIKLFRDRLFGEVRRGLVRCYESREENLGVLRGKIGVVQQMRLNSANPERLYCHYDEFLEDNALNQVLKAAVRLLLSVSRELSNQRKLAELLLMLDSVSDVPRQKLAWRQVRFDRMNERFRATFKLAELFLKKTPPDVTGGKVHGFSLFFDMNVLFEEYIGRVIQCMMRTENASVALQGKNGNQRYLAQDSQGKAAFAMKPDIVVRSEGQCAWIVDTKWKMLSQAEWREGVSQADLYQMYAYASCYDCPKVMLLYPHHEELEGEAGKRQSFSLNPWAANDAQKKVVVVGSVDLRELAKVPTQLAELLGGGVPNKATAPSVKAAESTGGAAKEFGFLADFEEHPDENHLRWSSVAQEDCRAAVEG